MSTINFSDTDANQTSILPTCSALTAIGLGYFVLNEGQLQTVPNRTGRRVSAVGLASPYRLEGQESNPGGGKISRSFPDRPWGTPILLHNRYWVFPGGKAAGAWF
jgi:hypothetical protein